MYTTNSVIDKSAKPYDADKTRDLVAQFQRDGYLFLKGVLNEKEVLTLREAMERKYRDPKMHEPEGDHIRGISMMRMYEYDINFRDLIAREPFVSLSEAILGNDCHMMSQNALRYEPGQGGGWHLDDRIIFPLPDNVLQAQQKNPLTVLCIERLIPAKPSRRH